MRNPLQRIRDFCRKAFAMRLQELTGCLIADTSTGRLIEPEALSPKNPVAVQELTRTAYTT